MPAMVVSKAVSVPTFIIGGLWGSTAASALVLRHFEPVYLHAVIGYMHSLLSPIFVVFNLKLRVLTGFQQRKAMQMV